MTGEWLNTRMDRGTALKLAGLSTVGFLATIASSCSSPELEEANQKAARWADLQVGDKPLIYPGTILVNGIVRRRESPAVIEQPTSKWADRNPDNIAFTLGNDRREVVVNPFLTPGWINYYSPQKDGMVFVALAPQGLVHVDNREHYKILFNSCSEQRVRYYGIPETVRVPCPPIETIAREVTIHRIEEASRWQKTFGDASKKVYALDENGQEYRIGFAVIEELNKPTPIPPTPTRNPVIR